MTEMGADHPPATSAVGGAIWSSLHCRGALSGRQRRSLVPWRKRLPVTWSKRTSTTSSGRSGSHSPLRSVLQRLGPPGAFPVKPGASAQRLELPRQGRALGVGDGGGEADMVELAGIVIEAQQQRADEAAVALVAEAADDAIGRAQALDLDHRPLAGLIGIVEALGDHAVGGAFARVTSASPRPWRGRGWRARGGGAWAPWPCA